MAIDIYMWSFLECIFVSLDNNFSFDSFFFLDYKIETERILVLRT